MSQSRQEWGLPHCTKGKRLMQVLNGFALSEDMLEFNPSLEQVVKYYTKEVGLKLALKGLPSHSC